MQAPKKDTKDLYLQYAALEEQYGLDRSAMAVYDQAVRTVPVDQRLEIYTIYLAKAREAYGARGIQKVVFTSLAFLETPRRVCHSCSVQAFANISSGI